MVKAMICLALSKWLRGSCCHQGPETRLLSLSRRSGDHQNYFYRKSK